MGFLGSHNGHRGPFEDHGGREGGGGGRGERRGGGGARFGKASVVCVCGDCSGVSDDVVNDVFCAVSLSGTMRSVMSMLLKGTAFGGQASLQPADLSSTHLIEHPTAACPRPMTHKCPQFCGIGKSWALSELCLDLVHRKKCKGVRSGEQRG